MHDNDWILTGYRPHLPRWRDVLYSIVGYWHNETVNIWTHIIGALASIAALVLLFGLGRPPPSSEPPRFGWLVNPLPSTAQPSVTWADAAMHAIFFLAATFCFSASASFHCVNCHSLKVRGRGESCAASYHGVDS
jgi:adiponectin receptor